MAKVSENKPHSIHLRLTEKQYRFCEEYAELMDMGVSDFIRTMVNGMMVTAVKASNAQSEKLGDLLKDENKTNDIEH